MTVKKIYRVYDVNTKELHEVDVVAKRCSCPDMGCEHYCLLHDLFSRDSSFVYQMVSALHKEIRRGDIHRARIWLRWSNEIRGDSKTKNYCKTILFEETRNMDLWGKWRGGKTRGYSSEDMVTDLCRSAKKWELPGTKWAADIAFKAVVDGFNMPLIQTDEIVAPDQDELEYYHWFRMLYRLDILFRTSERDRFGNVTKDHGYAETRRIYNEMLVMELGEYGLPKHAALVKADPGHFDHQWCALEAISGMRDPDANKLYSIEELEARWDPLPEGTDLITIPNYVRDWHTRAGKANVRKTFDSKPPYGKLYVPGDPLPHDLDLRWSGQFLGFWWRYHAFMQHGMDYGKKEWHEIDFNKRQWETVSIADKAFRKVIKPPCLKKKASRTS